MEEKCKDTAYKTREDDGFSGLLREIDTLAIDPNSDRLKAHEKHFLEADRKLTSELKLKGIHASRATFTLDSNAIVIRVSPLTVTQFHLEPGQAFKFHGEQSKALFTSIVKGTEKRGLITVPVGTFRKPILIALEKTGKNEISATTLSLGWLSITATALQEHFGLSKAEADIANLIFDGAVPKEVARVRDSSIETVRKQIRSVLVKTGSRSLTDLLHILYAFVSEINLSGLSSPVFPDRTIMKLREGAYYDISIKGESNGKPLLYIHGALGGRDLHPVAIEKLSDRKIIAPGRPFHGQSRTEGFEQTSQEAVAHDLVEILDKLNIHEVEILAYNSGVSYALALCSLIGPRIKNVVLVSPTPPISTLRDIMSMRRQERVFLLTAKASYSTALYLARKGGNKLLNDGPKNFGETVFTDISCDLDVCKNELSVQQLYWRGHAWHTEQGPEGFVADILNARSNWHKHLSNLNQPITYVVGEEDKTVLNDPLESLVKLTGGEIIKVKASGLSIMHAYPESWLACLN